MSDLIFIHVPKTGGMSVTSFCKQNKSADVKLLRGKRPHASVIEIRETVGAEVFDSATKFAVVRDPMARFRSACRQGYVRPNSRRVKALAKVERFPKEFRSSLLGRQSDMLCIDGELMVDKLFKFEEDVPDGVFSWLIEQGYSVEEGQEFPHMHKRRVRRPEPLSPETIEWVHEFYAPDYEMFGYE